MSEQESKTEVKEEIKAESPKEEVKKFDSIVSVKSDKPKFDFSGMFPEGTTTEEISPDEPKTRKPKNADYVLPTGLLGKTISSLFSMLGSRYPELQEQLKLSETEEELIDAAVKPLIDDFLTKTKTKASQISIILALVAIMLPRFVLIIKSEGERKKLAKLGTHKESPTIGIGAQ